MNHRCREDESVMRKILRRHHSKTEFPHCNLDTYLLHTAPADSSSSTVLTVKQKLQIVLAVATAENILLAASQRIHFLASHTIAQALRHSFQNQ